MVDTELCKVKLWTRAVFEIQSEFSQAESQAEIVSQAEDMFMAQYGV
ncbi:MAG: TetR/AcrR family transcriptional regulator C-terminal domain-containing protein [Rhodobacteraceae bacterium]|nr:TetR/AcrR family transcriptional regulator C-terminal domain-containing protein [Paracoccaceae bacterium]